MPHQNGHLLIIEDDLETRANLRDILEIDGYRAIEAGSFGQAMKREDWADIWGVILDRKLPDGTAEQWLPRLRAAAPSASIIIITGYHDLEGAIACLRGGADEYILKPLNADALRASLARIVQHRQAQVQLQQMQERLRQSDRLAAIGTLAAGLGHDMNNVLLPVRARLDALDASELSARAKDHFAAVRRSIAYLQQLSDGLHLLALDPEESDTSPAATHIATWWGQVGSLLRKAVPKRIAFASDIPHDVPDVSVPPHRLTQAMLNLVVNAAEAIPDDGEIRVWVKAMNQADTRTSDAQQIVQLGVSDTGEGMTADVRARALDPFFTTKKRGLGTGLGLSLVHGVVQSANGAMTIESSPNKGTTVTLSFPVATKLPSPHSSAVSDASRTAAITLKDQRLTSFISSLLNAAGFNVLLQKDAVEHSKLWILDSTGESVLEAKRYLRADRRRKMIAIGCNDSHAEEWINLGVGIIEDANNFEEIRRVISAAVAD